MLALLGLFVVCACAEDAPAPAAVGDAIVEDSAETPGVSDVSDAAAPPPPPAGYSAAGSTMRDPMGNALFLRGVNLSGRAKGAPGHLIDVDEALIAELLSDGVNSVRFLTFWDAVMPDSPQAVDEVYLSALRERVQTLSDAGLTVIIDVHQDLWGLPFAAHGAPQWACPEETRAGYEGGSPWWANYLSDQVTGCFDNFWGSSELQEAYADMLAAVAEATCDIERVAGFDIMNEPWPGSMMGIEGFDDDVLMPFYMDVLHRVETVCTGKLFFFEPSGAFTLGLAGAMQVPKELLDRVVVAPHFYPPYVHEPDGGGYGGGDQAHAALIDDLEGDWGSYLEAGVALWCGEYGGMTQSSAFDQYMQHLHTFFLQHFVSSAYWDHAYGDGGFAFLNAAGELKPPLAPVFKSPTPTLLPDRPAVFETDWAARSTTVTTRCTTDRAVAFLLPSPACTCESSDALEKAEVLPNHEGWRCVGDDEVTVTCTCP